MTETPTDQVRTEDVQVPVLIAVRARQILTTVIRILNREEPYPSDEDGLFDLHFADLTGEQSAEVAAVLGTAAACVEQLHRNRFMPPVDPRAAIAEQLGIPADALMEVPPELARLLDAIAGLDDTGEEED